ncbi:YcxB family protein [Flavobacterium sp.]|uniref:YcxB family protein n=1 Tax=Flavobacterium sp. TaxID=239 RepID=UPI0038FC4056
MDKETIIIKQSFPIKEYFIATFNILTNKIVIWFFGVIYFFILLVFILFLIAETNKTEILSSSYVTFLYPFFLLFALYIGVRMQLNNPKLKENILQIISKENYCQKGETFEIKYFWNDFIKIEEIKNSFLLYISKKKAIIILKKDLKDNQYNELKELINSLNIKKSLK